MENRAIKVRRPLKAVFVFSILLLGGVCAVTNPVLFAGSPTATIQPDKKQLESDVNFLCTLKPYRSNSSTASLDSAAAYIERTLRKAGYEPEEQKFFADGQMYKNVICSFGPKDAERLVVGAHYDVCGEQSGAD